MGQQHPHHVCRPRRRGPRHLPGHRARRVRPHGRAGADGGAAFPARGVEPAARDLVAAPIHLAINKRSRQVNLIDRYDKAIAEMQRCGEIDAIVAAEMERARRAAQVPRR